ncbi:MAG: MFS transporter [Dehalococcoidia bacterium]
MSRTAWISRQPTLLPGRPVSPRGLYLAMAAAYGVLTGPGLVIYGLYVVREAGLSPLELVLVGTALEVAAFVGEVPTGVVADAVSRRFSVVLSAFVSGFGFIIMGWSPTLGFIAAGQVIWGIGFTFRSGAREAWLADEIGEIEAGRTFIRAAQLLEVGRLASILPITGLALIDLQAPFLVFGALNVVLGVGLLFTMTERDYRGVAVEDTSGRWSALVAPTVQGASLIRRRHTLLALAVAAVLLGAWSESLDRLWPLQVVEEIGLPSLGDLGEPGWFALIALGTMVGGIVAAEVARRRVDVESPAALSSALAVLTLVLMAAALAFALAHQIWLALVAYWLTGWARVVMAPVALAWVNRGLDPRSRATVLSMYSQADAIGQVAGGPGIGVLAQLRGVVTALVTATLLLGATLPLYRLAARDRAELEEGAAPEA